MKRAMPPRAATWILGCVLSRPDKDAVIGDLIEEYTLRSRSDSSPGESWWYWSQVTRSVLPLLCATARQERWAGILGVAIAAYVLVTIIESAGEVVASRLLAANPAVHALISLMVGLLAMALGGYFAASMRHGAAAALAVIIGIIVIALMTTMSGSVPLWYQVAFLAFGPLASLGGGSLWRRRQCDKQVL